MTEILKTSGFTLVVYTNKNSKIFETAAEKVTEHFSDKKETIGIIYDDFNPNINVRDSFRKKYKNIKIFIIAHVRKTLKMDDKAFMGEIMKDSKFVPKHYTTTDFEPDGDNQLFYVKRRGSSGALGVKIMKYEDLPAEIPKDTVIQGNNVNPDLFEGKRYKIRVYVLLFNGKVYMNKKCWGSIATIDYTEDITDITQEDLKKMNIIHQTAGRKWITYKDLNEYETIFENLIESCKDFKEIYKEHISKIEEKEYAILGFDYVVNADKTVCIIEINQRSNYAHPTDISDGIDIPVIEDVMKLMIQDGIENTDFVHVE